MPLMLFMEADEDTMIERIMERAKSSGRNDDNIESLKLRFGTFNKSTMPVVEYYKKLGKLASVSALQTRE